MTIPAELQELLDKQALHELNVRYARGADRADYGLLSSVFNENAKVDAGVFVGSGEEFAKALSVANPMMPRCLHSITNENFEIRGNTAVGESYVTAFTMTEIEGQKSDNIVYGRYVDTYSKVGGHWKIDSRTFVCDGNMTSPCSESWTSPGLGDAKRGLRSADDPSYAIMQG